MRKLLCLICLFISVVTYSQQYDVVYVVDGDTADIIVDGEKVRLRFLDINTPERGQPGYKEAKEFVKDKILNQCITVELGKKGYYGRTLAYLYVDGVELNQELYCLGYAERYKYSKRKFTCN